MRCSLAHLCLGFLLSGAAAKPIVAVYDLKGPLTESGRPSASLFSLELEATRPLTLFDVSRSLKQAAADPDVKAVVVDVDNAGLGLAQAQEIRRPLRASIERALDRLDAVNESRIQLIGPDIQLRW